MAKRQNEFHSLKELMTNVIKENNLEKGMSQLSVEEAWGKLMGNGINSHTSSILLKGKTLVIKLNSSVLREELSYGKDKIIKLINEELGAKVISKLILS